MRGWGFDLYCLWKKRFVSGKAFQEASDLTDSFSIKACVIPCSFSGSKNTAGSSWEMYKLFCSKSSNLSEGILSWNFSAARFPSLSWYWRDPACLCLSPILALLCSGPETVASKGHSWSLQYWSSVSSFCLLWLNFHYWVFKMLFYHGVYINKILSSFTCSFLSVLYLAMELWCPKSYLLQPRSLVAGWWQSCL